MRHFDRSTVALAVAGLLFAAAGCNKGPAEAALKAADRALEAAKPELEKYTPGEFATLATAAKDARAQFEAGHYTEALKAAQGLPSRVQDALAAATTKKDELAMAWAAMAERIPAAVGSLTRRVDEITRSQKLPAGMDAAGLATTKHDLDLLRQGWESAQKAFRDGEVPQAVDAARGVENQAETLAAAIGVDLTASGGTGGPR
jgi:hypothetical protein